MHSAYSAPREQPPLAETYEVVVAALLLAGGWLAWYIARERYHFTGRQVAELACYLFIAMTALYTAGYLLLTARLRREREWPHPPLAVRPNRDESATQEAWTHDAVVLGYDVHGKPWLWPDRVRVMQGIVLGMTGSGKTTLLRNIITQDLIRLNRSVTTKHHVPMLIFDGKGDMEFFYSLLPYIHRAGRLHQLRVLSPARPDLSVRYNPFHCSDGDYMSVVNMVFGSFNLHDEFFAKHQLNYLADIVRVLVYTGLKFNFYDVLVMALDEEVLREQIEKARRHIQADREVSMQRGLNFEMSVRNLLESFNDRERVPKIQGLLNECMTFLDDEL